MRRGWTLINQLSDKIRALLSIIYNNAFLDAWYFVYFLEDCIGVRSRNLQEFKVLKNFPNGIFITYIST